MNLGRKHLAKRLDPLGGKGVELQHAGRMEHAANERQPAAAAGFEAALEFTLHSNVERSRLYFYTRISHALLFWIAFILTRPLGATLGDLLDKPHAQGGMELSRYTASAVIGAVIIFSILLIPQRPERLRARRSVA